MKKTSTILVLAILMVVAIKTSAQKTDCKYEKNEIDKFTKSQVLQTKSHRLTPFISSEGSLDVSALKG